ncbi:MAG: iron transporter [Bifidobacteriaceae bacterium]|nr:iron transporter [Bifidobacteriaceae bacterium]
MKSRTAAVLGGLSLIAVLGLSACGTDDKKDEETGTPSSPAANTETDKAAPAPGDEGASGFVEEPIGDPQSLPPLEVSGVYFQPVDMEPVGMGLAAAESDFHIEADISAGANDLGYGVGDFVPNLTVEYSIVAEDGTVKSEGTFMQMNASDGPHYGANVALKEAGTYKVTFTIHSPEENGHLLHVDKETGVTGRFWTEPIVAQWDWDYVPREW